jgi:ribonuclease HI
MATPNNHHLLLVESASQPGGAASWRFLLHRVDGGDTTAAADIEPNCSTNRAITLALVRGLEAIDSGGQVTLVTSSRYLKTALARGLAAWKRADWHWERFGRRVPVRQADLWQRVDRALQFHSLKCHAWNSLPQAPQPTAAPEAAWVPFAASVPVDAPSQQRQFAAPQVEAYSIDPAVIVVRKQQGRYNKFRTAACQAMRNVGEQITGLLDSPLAHAS